MSRHFLLATAGLLLIALRSSADEAKKARAAADPNDLAGYDARITSADREHWAFQPVTRPPVPPVRDGAWVRNPIDAFVLAGLEAEGLRPAPPVTGATLLRRVHLGVTGLPPSPGEVGAFVAGSVAKPQAAYEAVVDRLLASPHYGERWARHWLDLVRYAETNGYERDAARPFVWRYRDYVIRALNADKPFDRFVLEQLAGDELPDATAETMIATTYYRLGPWDDEPADPQEDRFDQLDDLVDTTAQAFLGLTLACARCHDHKFEPLTMHDYYRLAAVFNPLQRPTRGRTELTLPAGTRRELALFAERERSMALLQQASLASRGTATGAAGAPLADALRAGVQKGFAELPRGYIMHESPKAPDTHLLIRGKASRPGPKVGPGVPAVLVKSQPTFPPPGEATSLRRLTLAKWVASPDNPLTARVIVNRVWAHHFGEGIVRSPSDFGVTGRPPSHPELLDWLADRFVREGWSLKKLHRLILTSNTYQVSKRWDKEAAAKDPDNRLFWRFPRRRLEAEALRDGMLAASGKLDRTMYGPSTYPFIPKEALAGSSDPDTIWPTFNEAEASRRTVYAHSKRAMAVPLLELLDVCESSRSCDRRQVTTVAPQALSLFNGDFVNRQARHLADRLVREVGEDSAKQVEHAFRLALCRPPTADEREVMLRFLRREAGASGGRAALVQVCRVVFNLNEFAYVD